jgi:hypothetical protein
MKFKAIALLCFCGVLHAQGVSLEGLVGVASPVGETSYRANWSVHALYRFDQMVLFGPGIGYEGIPMRPAGIADGKLQVRLPLGRQLLPYVAMEAGAGLRPHLEDSYFFWRGGGGLDLKLGDRSSLLAEAGWTAYHRYYGRLGLLLDF